MRLSDEKLRRAILKILKDQVESKDYVYKKKIQGFTGEEVIDEVAKYYKKEPGELRRAVKRPLLGRKIEIYLLKRFVSLSNEEIGAESGIGYSGVSWIAQNVGRLIEEDKRVKRDVEKIILRLKV